MDWKPEKRSPPLPDRRYRTHQSIKCYVAYRSCGEGSCALYLNDCIERVVHLYPDGQRKVCYKNRMFSIREPEDFEKIVRVNLALKGGVILLGGSLHCDDQNQKITPDFFIDVTSEIELENYYRLRPHWIKNIISSFEVPKHEFNFRSCPPAQIDQINMSKILALIIKCGQVQKSGLPERVASAIQVTTCTKDSSLVACGVLKVPDSKYKIKKFAAAKSSLNSNQFRYEVGYFARENEARGHDLGAAIATKILEEQNNEYLFATTRADNRPMQTILLCHGFVAEGLPFKSSEGDYNLMLWIRVPKMKSMN